MSRESALCRSQRLREIAQEVGAELHDVDLSPLSPVKGLSLSIPDDERKADAILGQLKIEESASKASSKGLKRLSIVSKQEYTYVELYRALNRVIADDGLAGVVEVLLRRFQRLDGNVNVARRASNGMMRRMRSADSPEKRGQLLETATSIGRQDIVRLLCPFADQVALDCSLGISLDKRDLTIVEVLLGFGANAGLFEQHFQTAVAEDEIELLELFLRAKWRVSDNCLADCLLPAAQNGSLTAVLLLVHAGVPSDHQISLALTCAIQMKRVDIATALLTASIPPSGASLNQALDALLSTPSFSLMDSYGLVEIILCGGPEGSAANEGLFKATLLANVEIMQLLLSYDVDINYNEAAAVGHAIQRNRSDLVGMLLQNQTLKPSVASDLVYHIPPTSSSADKVSILSKLLVNGASGTHCSELLLSAAELNDLDLASLLISYGKDENIAPVCSVDYKSAKCLQIAVAKNNVPMVKLLALEGHPSQFSVTKAFTAIPSRLSREARFPLVQTLLRAGAAGDEVNTALHAAVTDTYKFSPLVELFVEWGATITDQTIFAAVSQGSSDTLSILLSANVSSSTCAAAISIAMKLPSGAARFRTIRLLLGPATSRGEECPEISEAVIEIIQHSPEDVKLLSLLCYEGKASINFQDGLAPTIATKINDPAVLDVLLQSQGGLPTPATVGRALRTAMDLPLTDLHRKHKIEALLRHSTPQDVLDNALIQEIKSAVTLKQVDSVIQSLLAAGADVDAQDGAPLCWAVSDPAMMDLILSKRPSPKTVTMAFPLAMTFSESEKYSLCEKLLRAGAVGEEISKALCVVVKDGPSALPLVQLLLPHADVNFDDGRAVRLAVRLIFMEGLDLLLAPKAVMPSESTKIKAFQEAMKVKGKQDRITIVRKLLKAGIPGPLISDALVFAVNTLDLDLTEVLLQSGASIEYKGGLAVRSAAITGELGLLRLLLARNLSSKPSLSTLTSGFAGSSELKDKDRKVYLEVLQLLLHAGLKGEAIDSALLDAVKEGDTSLGLTQLLCDSGASVEWKEGEAIDVAAKSAYAQTLVLLLGRQPSQNALKRAYRSGLELPKQQRLQVLEKILKAGKSIDKHVTKTLTFATEQTPSDRELIKLLLSFHVFDDGQSMVHAARSLDLRTLTLLVNCPKASDHISSAFREAVQVDSLWQSATGLGIVDLMLKKGASGDAIGEALYQAVAKCNAGNDALATQFLDVLLQHGADVNYQRGLPLQHAAMEFNVPLIRKLLPRATSDTKAMAIPYLFTYAEREPLLSAIESFNLSARNGDEGLDISFKHPDKTLQPVLFMALERFPRDNEVLRALLDTGYPPNQWISWSVDRDTEGEPWPVLMWALAQPQKKISNANIEMLIDEGANVNFKSKSGISPLTLAIENQRADIVAKLVSKGVNVTTPDPEGVTPLTRASKLGNTTIMESLLEADAECDDGSLHDAARELRLDSMRLLIKYGHHVDYPSDRHDGRSALAELCLKAVDNATTPANLEEAIMCLVLNNANIRLRRPSQKHSGKSIFHYALDSSDPMSILPTMLKTMWEFINEDCFLYKDSTYTYSLTKYTEKNIDLGPRDQKNEILRLLRIKGAIDRFWANDIDTPQPDDYCGAPVEIEREVMRQKTRQKIKSERREDAMDMLNIKRLTTVREMEIMDIQTIAEIKRDREKAANELQLLTARCDTMLQLETYADEERLRLISTKQLHELTHRKELAKLEVQTKRTIRQEAFEEECTRNVMQIEYMDARLQKENDGTRARLAIEDSARHDEDRILTKRHEREMARIKMQKQLVEKNEAFARRLQGTGMNQRQIGYVTGEVT